MKQSLDTSVCIKCKMCIHVCPVDLLEFKDDLVQFIPERSSICLECGQCMAICPTKAIQIEGYEYEVHLNELKENSVDYEKYSELISNRRSIRNYRDKPVEKELINKILDTIDYAPYGAAPEKLEITVVNDKKLIEQSLPHVEKFLGDAVGWMENPFIRFIIKRKAGMETFNTIKNHLYPMSKLDNYNLSKGDNISRGAPCMLIFHADKEAEEHTHNCMISATMAMFAAESLGLGGLMNGIMPAAINKLPKVREMFNIPKDHDAVISLLIGYPKFKYKRSIKRTNKKVHWLDEKSV